MGDGAGLFRVGTGRHYTRVRTWAGEPGSHLFSPGPLWHSGDLCAAESVACFGIFCIDRGRFALRISLHPDSDGGADGGAVLRRRTAPDEIPLYFRAVRRAD